MRGHKFINYEFMTPNPPVAHLVEFWLNLDTELDDIFLYVYFIVYDYISLDFITLSIDFLISLFFFFYSLFKVDIQNYVIVISLVTIY